MAGLVPGPASHHHTSARWTARRLAVLSVAVALALLTLLSAPGRSDPSPIRAADPDPFLEVMRLLAFEEGKVLVISPTGVVTDEDILGDVTGKDDGVNDVTNAGYAFLPSLPPWLLMRFACDGPGVACPSTGSADSVFADGGYLFYERLAQAPESIAPAVRGEWGPVLALAKYPTAPAGSSPFSRASHAIITRVQGTTSDVLYFALQDGSFQMFRTSSRSLRSGNDLLTLVPKAKEIQTDPVGWDVYAYASNGTEAGTGRDNLRGFDGAAMLEFTAPPTIEFEDAPATTTTTSTSTTTASSTTSSSTTTETSTSSQTSTSSTTTQATSTATTTGTSGGGDEIPWVLVVIAGIGLALVGGFILFRGRGGSQGATGGGAVTGGGGTVTSVASGGDPCPPLIAAAKEARQACEDAVRAAKAATDAARARAAEVDAARAEVDKARRAREAAEKELARRQKPPDRGGDLASTTFGGRTVTEDSYDLHLLEEARAAANDAWEAAKSAATTDAERQAANDAWVEELKRLDGPDGIDEVRRRDKEGRAKWVKEAEEALKAAQDAEAAAQAALDRAVAAAKAAQEAADVARNAAADACARADAAEKAAIDAGCLPPAGGAEPGGQPAGGGAQPPAPEPPTPPRPPEPPPTPPTPPRPPEPPPTPPTKPRPPRECPDDAEPRVTERNAIEVDLYLISESQLKIDRNYPYGENVDEALDQLDQTLAATGLLTDLEGAVSSPVTSILGQLGVPGFDTVTDAPTDAAIKSMRKLKERMEKFRKTGTWSLSIPLQHYRFVCRVTEACVDGRWVETKREFVGERVGKPRWVESPPYEVQIVAYDSDHAWTAMTANYTRQNAAAEQRIAAAATACGG